MKVFVVFSALFAVALAGPGIHHGVAGHAAVVAPLAYASIVPGAPIGPDGRVVDTPEVAVAKAAHTAAHYNEKVTLANEAVKSADFVAYSEPAVVSAYAAPAVVSTYAAPGVIPAYGAHLAYSGYLAGAPIGADGRVVDTPEVAIAKAAHTAAHYNEKLNLVNEAVKSADFVTYPAPAVVSAYAAHGVIPAYGAQLAYSGYFAGAPIGADGRVVDTPEVAIAKAAYTAAHYTEKFNLVNEAAKNNALYGTPAIISA